MQRRGLKYRLQASRTEFSGAGMYPVCPICEKPVFPNTGDMHEVFVTRGHAVKSNADIFIRENCVLVHHGTCHKTAQHSVYGRWKCMDYLIRWEGPEKIIAFSNHLEETTNTLGDFTMVKEISELVKKLKDKGIEADGSINNALELATAHHKILFSYGADSATGEWRLVFNNEAKPVITKEPVQEILIRLLKQSPKEEPKTVLADPSEEKKSFLGKRSDPSEDA